MTLSPSPQRPPADDVGRELVKRLRLLGYQACDLAADWIETRLTQSETRAGAVVPELHRLREYLVDLRALNVLDDAHQYAATTLLDDIENAFAAAPQPPAPQRTVTVEQFARCIADIRLWPGAFDKMNEVEREACLYEARAIHALIYGPAPAPDPAREIERLRKALVQIVDEKCDYMRINNLGDPETQHTVKTARAALAASSPTAPADALGEALREIEEFTSKANGGLDGVLNFICKKALSAHTASSTGAGNFAREQIAWAIRRWHSTMTADELVAAVLDAPAVRAALPAAPTGQGSVGPEWRDIISAPRNGELVKLGWWVGNQWVPTHGLYVGYLGCWVDEENFRLEPQKWAPADQENAG